MRILYITNGFPFPLTSGYLRHAFLIRELAGSHEVTLCSVVRPDFRPQHAEALRPHLKEIVTVASPDGSARPARKALGRVRTAVLGPDRDRSMGDLRRAVGSLVERGRFDVVVMSGKRTYPALCEVPSSIPVVTDLCDATSVHLRGRLSHAPVASLPAVAAELAEVRRVERRLLAQSALVLFASERDRDALVEPDERRTAIVVPNGVDVDYWRRRSRALGSDIVFTGVMQYPPNEDAAVVLADQVLRRVRERMPDARLWLAGRDPGPRVRRLGARSGVVVTGLVDDLRPYLERAAVFVAPLRFGAGIQNKVLEAMAMEVPVVASPVAVAGLHAEGREPPPVTVADGPGPTAAAIVSRLEAPAPERRPDAAGRRFVESTFGWERSGALLEQALQSVAGRVPPGRRAVSD